MGESIVLSGALLGLIFTAMVAVLNFVGHRHLPYKKMLVLTGVMLAMVLFVMIGEQVQEMQQAGWLGTANIAWLQWLPAWAGTWFSLFPNWQTIIAQAGSVLLVLGSYALARYQAVALPKKQGAAPFQLRAAPPMEDGVGTPLSFE
jgi:high-affinity iron transporter